MIVLASGEIIRLKEMEGGPLENAARFRVFFERSTDAMSLLDPQTLPYIEATVPFDGRTLLPLVTERKQAEAESLRTQANETVTNSKQSEYCVSGATFLVSINIYGSRRQAFVTRLRTVVGGDSGRYSPDGGAGAS